MRKKTSSGAQKRQIDLYGTCKMNTERILEVGHLLVSEIEGHDIQSQCPADLVFRVGNAEDTNSAIRFVAHDGTEYRDVAFVSNNRFDAIAVDTPSLSFSSDDIQWGSVCINQSPKAGVVGGSIDFRVHDGTDTTNVMKLNSDGATVTHVSAETIQAASINASTLHVENTSDIVAEFSKQGLQDSVRVGVSDHDLCIFTPSITAENAALSNIECATASVNLVKATEVRTPEISIEGWLVSVNEDGNYFIDGTGDVVTENINCRKMVSEYVIASSLNVVSHNNLFATFGNASVERLPGGNVAWCGDVLSELIVSKSGQIDFQASRLGIGPWLIDTDQTSWRLRHESSAVEEFVVDRNGMRIGHLTLNNNTINVPEVTSERLQTEALETEEASIHSLHASDITASHVSTRQLKSRLAQVETITAATIEGGDLEVFAESLTVHADSSINSLSCDTIVTREMTTNKSRAQELQSNIVHTEVLKFENSLCIANNDNTAITVNAHGCVGVNVSTPSAHLDVDGNCRISGSIELGTHTLRNDGAGVLTVSEFCVFDAERGSVSINDSERVDSVLHVGRKNGNELQHLITLSGEHATKASIDVTDKLYLTCEAGVSIPSDLHVMGDVQTGALAMTNGLISSSAAEVRLVDGNRNVTVFSDCIGLNVDHALASLHLQCENTSLPVYLFEKDGDKLVGTLDNGIRERCSRFTWETGSAHMQLGSSGLSVSSHVSADTVSSTSIESYTVSADVIDAKVINFGDTTLESRDRKASISCESLTLDGSMRYVGASKTITFVDDSREHAIGMENNAFCIKRDENTVLKIDDVIECTIPLHSSDVTTDRLVVNGADGARISLDYPQMQTLSRMSQFVRVEGSPDILGFQEQTLEGTIPAELLRELENASDARDSADRSIARNTDMVVLADAVRIDTTQFISTVPVVATQGVNANNTRVSNLADPQEPQDAVTLSFLSSYIPTLSVSTPTTDSILSDLSVNGLLTPFFDSPLTVTTDEHDVASFTTSNILGRMTISSTSDAIVTTTDGVNNVSFGYSHALNAFALGGSSSLQNDIWMTVHEHDGSGAQYSEARFSGHLSVRNPTPLFSLFNSNTNRHTLQLSPFTIHLGDPSDPFGTVDIANVGHAFRVNVDGSGVMFANNSGLSVSTMFADTVLLGTNRVNVGASPTHDIIFSKYALTSSNIGTQRTWNAYHDGSALMFQNNGHALVQTFDTTTGELEFDFSVGVNNLGSGVSFVPFSTPSLLMHRLGVSINTRNTTNGLQVNGGIIVENSTATAECNMTCSVDGSLDFASSSSLLRFVDAPQLATIICNRLSVGQFLDAVNAPSINANAASITNITANQIDSAISNTYRGNVQWLSVHNLFVSGTTTALNVQTIQIPDSFIHLAVGNPTDVTDTGLVSHYSDASGATQMAGVIRDANLKKFKFIQSLPSSSLPIDASGTIVLNPSDFELAPVAVSELNAQNLISTQTIQAVDGNSVELSIGNLFAERIGHGFPGLSIGANFITTHTSNSVKEIAGTISTSSMYSQNMLQIGPWRLENVQRTYGGFTRDELVFTHVASGRSAFRIRQPDQNP